MDLKEIIEAAKTAGLSSTVISAILIGAGFCWGLNKLIEAALKSNHARRETFDWLVESLGKPTVQQSRYLIEQAYARYVGGDAIQYDDLEALLKRKAPSLGVRKFASYRRYIQIRHEDSEFEFRPQYANRLYRTLLQKFYLVAYCMLSGAAGMFGLFLHNQHALFSSYISYGLVLMFFLGLFTLNRYTDLSAALDFMEPGAHDFLPIRKALDGVLTLTRRLRRPSTPRRDAGSERLELTE